MTVQQWRNRHRRCYFCKHCKYVMPPYGIAPDYYRCEAKCKIVNENIPRPFCRLFEQKKED